MMLGYVSYIACNDNRGYKLLFYGYKLIFMVTNVFYVSGDRQYQ